MASMPDIEVSIALTSGYQTPAASRTWTDVTSYVEGQDGLSIKRGRGDQFSTVQPSTLTLTLNNTDGRFTPENAAGAYYPNIKKGRPIRVRAKSPLVTEDFADSSGLLLGANSSVTGGQMVSNGLADGYWWFTGSEWVASGDFTLTYDSYIVTARDIINFAFWMTDTITTATYDGFMFRLDTDPNSMGFYQFTNGVHGTRINALASAGVPAATWIRTTITGVASTGAVTVSAVNRDTAVVYFSQSTTLPAGNRSGTFGQKHDGAGTSHYIDNITMLGGPGSYTERFTGYVDEWPVDWPGGSDKMSTVTISATSRMARLGRTAELRSIVEEEALYDTPVLYWPMGEPQGSTTAGNIAPGRSERLAAAQVGTGGTLEFGQGTGPDTDDLSAPTFTPVDATNGLNLQADLIQPLTRAGDTWFEVECWFTAGASAVDTFLVNLFGQAGRDDISLALCISSAGVPFVRYSRAIGFASVVNHTATNARNGSVHHFVGICNLVGADMYVQVFYDGVSVGPVTGGNLLGVGTIFPEFSKLTVGGSLANDLHNGTMAHVAVYRQATTFPTGRFTAHYNSGMNGFSGETSGARIQRYARLAGIPAAEIDTETGLAASIAHKDTTGDTPLSLMEDVAKTEDGVVFDARDGDLTFHGRSHRYNSSSAFTLDASSGDVEEGLLPRLDDQNMVNDMKATRAGGAEARATNDASIAEYGSYKDTVDLLTTSDTEVQSRANWRVQRFGTPRVTIPNVRVNLFTARTTALQASLLAADIGTRFTVTNLPSQAPSTTMDFFIEGVAEDIGAPSYYIEFNTSAAAYGNVWQLGSVVFSQLGSTTTLAY